jgi:hypothetical protein
MKKIKKMTLHTNDSVAKEESGRISCGRRKSLSFRFGMKTYSVFKYVCLATIIVVASCFVTGCTNDEYWSDSTLSKNEYESILKKEIDGLITKSGRLEESFFYLHGMPVWESSKWVNIDDKDMLVVPLLSSKDHNKKYIIGIVENGKISTVITELSETDVSKNRILALNNQVLYDAELSTLNPRLKNGNEVAGNLLLNGGSAQTLFAAANGANTTYNSQAIAGTLCIVVGYSSSSSSSSSSDFGHAWIQFTDNFGNITTIGLWGNQNNDYNTNLELESNWSAITSHCVSITYLQFQSILNYNANADNLNYHLLNNNCSNYAAGIWNATTGTNINGGLISTPGDIESWINNH